MITEKKNWRIIKALLPKRCQAQTFWAKPFPTFKELIITAVSTAPQQRKLQETSSAIHKARTTLIPKADQNGTKKKMTAMNRLIKILKKILAIPDQVYIKMIIVYDQVKLFKKHKDILI